MTENEMKRLLWTATHRGVSRALVDAYCLGRSAGRLEEQRMRASEVKPVRKRRRERGKR